MKRTAYIARAVCAFLLWTPAAAVAQLGGESEAGVQVKQNLPGRTFLGDHGLMYENYAHEEYEIPDFTHYARVNYYGPMGNYLIRGYDVYSWRELRTNTLTEESRSMRLVPRWNRFERNVVAQDSYGKWSGCLILGDEIRTLFTPLTLRLVGFDGVRLDTKVHGGRYTTNVSAIAQRYMAEFTSRRYGQFSTWDEWDTSAEVRDAAFLLGGHADVDIGALRVGATGVNLHAYDAHQANFDLRGQLQSKQVLPSFLIVKFADETPEDDRGGAVINALELCINGEKRTDIQPFVVKVNTRNPTAVGTTNFLTGEFRRFSYQHEGTYFADVMYLEQHLRGEDVSRQVNLDELLRWVEPLPPGGTWKADGYDAVLAYYDLRQEDYVRGVQVRALVGNDYQVQAMGLHVTDDRTNKEELKWSIEGHHIPSKETYTTDRVSPGVQAHASSEGNVQDLSNLDWVVLNVGEWTGRAVLGVNGSWDHGDTRIRWEYARGFQFWEYPDGKPGYVPDKQTSGIRSWNGDQSTTTSDAYYITAEWQRGMFEAGGELFCIEDEYDSGFVEDNDDNDRYPDIGAQHRPVIFWTSPEYDPDGVFPGKDEDNDGIPDTNKNSNELPDYTEPFLRFDVEPDEYVYGRDWNNNGVPDEREDDLRADYPYEVDQEGWHVYGRLNLPYGLSVRTGRLDAQGIASGGRNENLYGSASFAQSDPGWGYLRAEAMCQRIRDDIEDPYVRFEEVLTGSKNFPTYSHQTIKDLRAWRNSIDYQYYGEGRWRVTPALNVWGHVHYQLNRQLAGALSDGTEQAPDRIRYLAVVAKSQYTWEPAREWQVVVQGKGLLLRQSRESLPVDLVDQYTLMPVIKVRYALTDRTQIWAGTEGLLFLPLKVKDRTDGRNSVEEQVQVAQVINHSSYFGYNIAMNLGLRKRSRKYQDPARQEENLDATTIFMRVLLGFDE